MSPTLMAASWPLQWRRVCILLVTLALPLTACDGDDGGPCNTGMEYCAEGCVNLGVSATNCGRCGDVCPQGARCILGDCTAMCPGEGLVDCDYGLLALYCVDINRDAENCGRCGRGCDPGEDCVAKECVPADDVADAGLDGSADGALDGSADGALDGSADGALDGSAAS